MSKKNLIILALILVVVAIATQLANRPGKKQTDAITGNPILAANMVEAFDEVLIQDEKGKLHLQKKEGLWTIQEKDGYPLDMKKLLEMVENLTRQKVASRVTQDKQRLPYFKLVYQDEDKANSENSGTQLTLQKDGQEIFRLIAGKKRQSKSSRPDMPAHDDGTYLRIGQSSNVYLTKETLSFDTEVKEWIQTTLFRLDSKEIESIRYEANNSEFELARAEKDKDLEITDLGEKEQMKTSERSSLLKDLEDFKIDEIIERSPLLIKELELKSKISLKLYNSAPLTFNVYSKLVEDPMQTDKEKKEKEYSYFASFASNGNIADNSKWKPVTELGEKWLFKLDEWKAKRWIKSRKDYIEEKK